MEKFMVEFKDIKKQRIIESQSDAVAKEWGEKQLKAWGEASKVVVTPYLVEAEKTAEKPAEPAADPKAEPKREQRRRGERRTPKNPGKIAL
jgi:hypothetical protein